MQQYNESIGKKNIITNIYRIQACDSMMCRYFYIEFIGFRIKGEALLDSTNLLSPNEFEKIKTFILKYFQ